MSSTEPEREELKICTRCGKPDASSSGSNKHSAWYFRHMCDPYDAAAKARSDAEAGPSEFVYTEPEYPLLGPDDLDEARGEHMTCMPGFPCGASRYRPCDVNPLLATLDATESDLARAREALKDCLEWMGRYRSGDKTLDPEEYYVVRDGAQALLEEK